MGGEPRSPGCGRQSDPPPPRFSFQALSTRTPRLQPYTHPQIHSPPRLEIQSHHHHPAPLPMKPPLQKHPDPSQAYFKITFYSLCICCCCFKKVHGTFFFFFSRVLCLLVSALVCFHSTLHDRGRSLLLKECVHAGEWGHWRDGGSPGEKPGSVFLTREAEGPDPG